jgi:hypothetical protein
MLAITLLGAFGCGDGSDGTLGPPEPPLEPSFGTIQVLTQTATETPEAILDPDGFTVAVDSLTPRPIELNGTVTFSNVAAGNHIVALDGLQVNCTTPENPASVMVAADTPTRVTFPVTCWAPTTGRIAFSASLRGVWEIYTINPDGTDLRRVTTVAELGPRPPVHIWPAWSPDGWKIAYTHLYNDKGNQDIFVVNADGTGATQLTTASGRDNYPAWSPDGSKIAFSSDRDDLDNLNIYLMNADGTDQVRLTEGSHYERPTWSPDGSKILFSGGPLGWDIYMMNPDGTSQVRLTDPRPFGEAWLSGPNVCSPDGSRILFTSAPEESWDAYVMNADGTGWARLTDWEGSEEPAAWSPEGSRILFTSTKTNLIHTMNADGTGVRTVTHGVGGRTVYPDWSHGTRGRRFPPRIPDSSEPRDTRNFARPVAERHPAAHRHSNALPDGADALTALACLPANDARVRFETPQPHEAFFLLLLRVSCDKMSNSAP